MNIIPIYEREDVITVKIGIFGGTFDPPHKGHIKAASAAVKEVGLNKLIIVPDYIPPHKSEFGAVLPPAARLELTKLAMDGIDCAEVSDIEITRADRSFTIDTVNAISAKYNDAKLYLLMGTDMLEYFERWKSFREILDKTTLAVVTRRDGDLKRVRECADNLTRKYGAKVQLVPHIEVEISSTDLRAMLPMRRGCEYLNDKVYSEIIKNRFYGARPSYQWLREKAYAMLNPARIPHVKGCEEMAEKLASRWGADVEKAREAAILHDITKKYELKEQLDFCEKYGIKIDNIEREENKLLHSKTGAAIARYEFGCDDEVVSAIEWHTTGRSNMTLLDKIMYMADYVEPNRDFDGVEQLRSLAFQDLDVSLAKGFQMSIDDMLERDITPHKRTVDAYLWITEIIKQRGR